MRRCEVCGCVTKRVGYVILRPRETPTAVLTCMDCFEWIAARQAAINPPLEIPETPEKVAQANARSGNC